MARMEEYPVETRFLSDINGFALDFRFMKVSGGDVEVSDMPAMSGREARRSIKLVFSAI